VDFTFFQGKLALVGISNEWFCTCGKVSYFVVVVV
jgi:hypothetical protein